MRLQLPKLDMEHFVSFFSSKPTVFRFFLRSEFIFFDIYDFDYVQCFAAGS